MDFGIADTFTDSVVSAGRSTDPFLLVGDAAVWPMSAHADVENPSVSIVESPWVPICTCSNKRAWRISDELGR
jgi:hypothetical protein